ncbi:hypothetical protein BEWA_023110 [Theileria equi strain WA]|uniref:Uncharacterized protein n=1 Tax=Theileria equi strain WA TaxID=1537102 RepID=L0AV30_THEEQ|nr:hypothetical protein BEWA_023110 [Theileria equi strain WA]AFZ79462.1 hypothetical protein BEWA_023110 [Theileria equi strain WA]|eukprot:XP_004829128.1 hypothetical protein BEWA_023110 [Theileria equi strain WA]
MSDCVRGSIWSYANIDVLNKYGYNACGHTVTPKKENTQIREFKTYIHKFPGKSLYLGGIYHNGTKQYGFKYINSCHTDLAVYYWSYDDANFCPLLIRVTKTWWSWNSDYYHEYYAQTGINTNQWTKDGIGDNVYSGFQKIINEECFKRVVVLNLSQTNNGSQYGVDGKPNSEVNPTVKIQVSGPTNVHTDYRKYIHRLSSGSMNILCTKHEGKHRPFQKFVLSTPYNEAYIYYSSKDTGHTKPLILQLGAGSDFYKLDGGEKWVHDSKITSKGLKDALDKENDTHVIDIFQNKGQYQCTSPTTNYLPRTYRIVICLGNNQNRPL